MKLASVLRLLAGCAALSTMFTVVRADVDARNLNFSETFTQFHVGEDPQDADLGLKFAISYNSRSRFEGPFGFGWCTDIESSLALEGDGALVFTECGGGAEYRFEHEGSIRLDRNRITELFLSLVRRRNPDYGLQKLEELRRDLTTDTGMFDEFVKQTSIQFAALLPGTYVGPAGFSALVHPDLSVEIHHANGRRYLFGRDLVLHRIEYPDREFIAIARSPEEIRLTTSTASFVLALRDGTVTEVTSNGQRIALYEYHKMGHGSALVSAHDAWGKRYVFRYDELMNLVRIDYPDRSAVEIEYDQEKDWAVALVDRLRCRRTYLAQDWPVTQEWSDLLMSEQELLQRSDKGPYDLYGTEVRVVCNGVEQGRNVFLFAHKNMEARGRRYMSGYEAIRNGRTDDVTFFLPDGRREKSIRSPLRLAFTKSEQDANGEIIRSTFFTARYRWQSACSPLEFSGWMNADGVPDLFFEGGVTFVIKPGGTNCEIAGANWATPGVRLTLTVTGSGADRAIAIDAIVGDGKRRLYSFQAANESAPLAGIHCGIRLSEEPTAEELRKVLESPRCAPHERAPVQLALVLFAANGPDERANCGCIANYLEREPSLMEAFATQLLRSDTAGTTQ